MKIKVLRDAYAVKHNNQIYTAGDPYLYFFFLTLKDYGVNNQFLYDFHEKLESIPTIQEVLEFLLDKEEEQDEVDLPAIDEIKTVADYYKIQLLPRITETLNYFFKLNLHQDSKEKTQQVLQTAAYYKVSLPATGKFAAAS